MKTSLNYTLCVISLYLIISCNKNCSIDQTNNLLENKIKTLVVLNGIDTIKNYYFVYNNFTGKLEKVKWVINSTERTYTFTEIDSNHTLINFINSPINSEPVIAYHINHKFRGFASADNPYDYSGAVYDFNDTLRELGIGFTNGIFTSNGITELKYTNGNLSNYVMPVILSFPSPSIAYDTIRIEYLNTNVNYFTFMQIGYLANLFSENENILSFLTQNDIYSIKNKHLIYKLFVTPYDGIESLDETYNYEFDYKNRVTHMILTGTNNYNVFITYY